MHYFDYAASNPLDPRVRKTIEEADALVGNPSSLHAAGRELRQLIDASRRSVAKLLACEPGEIVFTSGATESNTMAVVGLVRASGSAKPHVLASPVEHPSVVSALERLAQKGEAEVEYLKVDGDGRVSAAEVSALFRPDTALVCVMWANNVLGTIQPIAEIGAVVIAEKAKRGPEGMPLRFFSDAVQAMSTQDVLPVSSGIDALSFSAHKMYGPKGVGGLYFRRGVKIEALMSGGDQEAGVRSGTENVSGIAGIGKAAEILLAEREKDARHAETLRQEFLSHFNHLNLFSPLKNCLPGIIYLRSGKDDGETFAMKLDVAGIAVSTGSACAAGSRKPSHVLAAVFDENTARKGGIRISFGRFTAVPEVQSLVEALVRAGVSAAALSPAGSR